MKYLILLFLFACSVLTLQAQTAPAAVSNVTTQVSNEQDKVTITYDLARRAGVTAYTISVRITLDGELITAQALGGDIGPNIAPGYGKRIIWDVRKDLSELYGALKVDVSAQSNAPDCIPIKTIPVYAGLSGAGAAGLALILSGLKSESDSKELYDIYTANTNPSASVYTELSREDHYLEANSKHKKGTWLAVGGGTVIVAGGAILISRLIQINKYNKKCAGKISDASPKWNISPLVRQGDAGGTMAAGIAVNF